MSGFGYGYSYGFGSRRAGAAPLFDPASLFGVSDQGVFFDPNPTTCGVAVGSGVATLTDSSGKGNNATQATAGNRPILQQTGGLHYLDFDGTDDWLETAAFDMAPSDKLTVILGLTKEVNTPQGMAIEFSTSAFTSAGAFYLAAPEGTGSASDYRFYARGNAAPAAAVASGTFFATDTCILTATADAATSTRILRRNGVQVGSSALAMGGGNFRAYPLYLGRRAGSSLPFNGRIFGLIVINRLLTAEEFAAAEAWMAARTGVALA